MLNTNAITTASIEAYKLLKPHTITGSGHFTQGDCIVFAEFTIVHYPRMTQVIVVTNEMLRAVGTEWHLVGTLSDKKTIQTSLVLTHLNHSFHASDETPGFECTAVFMPIGFIKIVTKPQKYLNEAQYPLIGYHYVPFSVKHDGWTVTTIPATVDQQQAATLFDGWRYKAEGMSLHLKHENASITEYEQMAHKIACLLSLATGRGVSFDRQILMCDNNEIYQIYSRSISQMPGAQPCIPSYNISRYLEQSLTRYDAMKDDGKQRIKLLGTYIALSGGDAYIDIRLLYIWQAWEIAANFYCDENPLADDVKELLSEIRVTWKKWNAGHKDPDGQLMSDIAGCLKGKPAIRQIESYARSLSLDTNAIGLDFTALKNARNRVVHYGIMTEQMRNDKRNLVKLLSAAQRGLQLALLLQLGYDGQVECETNGWRDVKDIHHFVL